MWTTLKLSSHDLVGAATSICRQIQLLFKVIHSQKIIRMFGLPLSTAIASMSSSFLIEMEELNTQDRTPPQPKTASRPTEPTEPTVTLHG